MKGWVMFVRLEPIVQAVQATRLLGNISVSCSFFQFNTQKLDRELLFFAANLPAC